MPEMEKELIEHKIVIDEYMTATLKIPKVLTAMELAALMAKAKKMFNISDAQIEQPSMRKKSTSDYIVVPITKEQEREILSTFDTKMSDEEKDEMAEKYGYATRQKLYSKYQNLKKKYKDGTPKKSKRKGRYIWTEAKEKKLKKLYKTIPNTEIAEKFGLKRRQIQDKLYELKKKRIIK